MKFRQHSKAGVLQEIESLTNRFTVPKLISLNALKFKENRESISRKLSSLPNSQMLVVRSSACDEDESSSSSAGEYDSFLNIPVDNYESILEAITKFAS